METPPLQKPNKSRDITKPNEEDQDIISNTKSSTKKTTTRPIITSFINNDCDNLIQQKEVRKLKYEKQNYVIVGICI